MSYKYKLIGSDGTQITADGIIFTGVGVTKNGYIESETPIEHPSLQLVTEEQTVEQPAAAHMTSVAPQNAQPVVAPVEQPAAQPQVAPQPAPAVSPIEVQAPAPQQTPPQVTPVTESEQQI